jgi:multiple sugar transport system permease protein
MKRKKGYFARTKVQDTIAGYLFIMPNLVGFLVFTLGGILFSLMLSFTNWSLLKDLSEMKFIGLRNFVELYKDKWFIDAFWNNIWFLCIIPIQIFLALVVANLLNGNVIGKSMVTSMIYIPYITSTIAIGVVWMTLFNPASGPINHLLMKLGVEKPPSWLSDVKWAKPAISIVIIWNQLGYHTLLYLSALQAVPTDLYEAAKIDGANRWQQFRRITIPMVSPTTFLIIVLAMISSFQSWSMVQVLTKGGPGTATQTIGYYIYVTAFQFSRMGQACSMSWFLFIIVFGITLIQWQGQKNWVNYL